MGFDLKQLLEDVFAPQPGEAVLVACDEPHGTLLDTDEWRERREMAEEWRSAFEDLGRRRGFRTLPLLRYPATGANGAELPREGRSEDRPAVLEEALLGSTLAVFLTEFSATAPLDGICRRKPDFRAASMPGVQRWMEQTSLAADYREVARKCGILFALLEGAEALEVTFSTGHRCRFDLRFRKPEADDGSLPRGKAGDRIINLPSGETFIVPYEGEREGVPSQTAGELPVRVKDEVAVLRIEGNRVRSVDGDGAEARQLREMFAVDSARTNIAEVAFGCNDRARVTGNVLEDEKAGFHWAYGRSDHLGGTVGVAAFARPQNVVHQDIVYAAGSPISVREAVVVRPGGARAEVMRDGAYRVF